MGYTKLFSSIVASTIWREDNETRLVWITMLAMKNERHVVEASIPGLADLARVTMEDCKKALRKLSSPDEYSRNQENQGRRIMKCDGGWKILNGEHYRRLMSEEDRKAYKAAWQKEYRKRRKTIEHDGAIAGARQAVSDGFAELKDQPVVSGVSYSQPAPPPRIEEDEQW